MRESYLTEGISSEHYTEDYFTSACHGYEEFFTSNGSKLPLRLSLPLKIVSPQRGMRILDIGCGRGEFAVHMAAAGAEVWAVDYAEAALKIAQRFMKTLEGFGGLEILKVKFIQGSALHLPFPSNSMDVVTMLDVVEHLTPVELNQALSEARRILAPRGRLVVHTMPNLWYYRYGYPLYRQFQNIRGQRLPADPRDRWRYKEVHINEQTPNMLRETLQQNGFKTKVWLQSTQTYEHESSRIVRLAMKGLTQIPGLRRIFCNDIFAIGVKP